MIFSLNSISLNIYAKDVLYNVSVDDLRSQYDKTDNSTEKIQLLINICDISSESDILNENYHLLYDLSFNNNDKYGMMYSIRHIINRNINKCQYDSIHFHFNKINKSFFQNDLIYDGVYEFFDFLNKIYILERMNASNSRDSLLKDLLNDLTQDNQHNKYIQVENQLLKVLFNNKDSLSLSGFKQCIDLVNLFPLHSKYFFQSFICEYFSDSVSSIHIKNEIYKNWIVFTRAYYNNDYLRKKRPFYHGELEYFKAYVHLMTYAGMYPQDSLISYNKLATKYYNDISYKSQKISGLYYYYSFFYSSIRYIKTKKESYLNDIIKYSDSFINLYRYSFNPHYVNKLYLYKIRARAFFDKGDYYSAYVNLHTLSSRQDSIFSESFYNQLQRAELTSRVKELQIKKLKIEAKTRRNVNYLISIILILLILSVFYIYQKFKKERRIKEELKEQTSKAQEVENIKHSFLHNIDKDINIPVQVMKHNIDLLVNEKILKSEFPIIKNILFKSTNAIVSMIDDMLNTAYLDNFSNNLKIEKINIGAIIESEVHKILLNPIFAEKSIKFSKNIDKNVNEIYTNKSYFTQLLRELLENAYLYTLKGEINVKVSQVDNKAQIMISDTGCGIEYINKELIFNKFFKASIVQGQGSGLGLYMCRKLTDYLGGEIYLASSSKKGSIFIINLDINNKINNKNE
ncbi:MAG: HAMP domain-containing sensor histidine kinase [Bacteroidales bacterium]